MSPETLLEQISAVVWGPATLTLLLGVGIYLSVGLKAVPQRNIKRAFLLLGSKSPQQEPGEITPFQALMTSLSATIGTGNIAGVATAIFLGGPGAVFWMWVTAFLGLATKYTEAVLAVQFRQTNSHGQYLGGPMYYIKNGLNRRWHWLGWSFALFGMFAAFGIGNMVQANSVANAVLESFHIPVWGTALVLTVMAGSVILGGLPQLAKVTATLVPLMAIAYLGSTLFIIFSHLDQLTNSLTLIFTHAFNGTAATGGFAGATLSAAIRFGVARGVFSNEAGLGSSPIAHAAAKTNNPVQQGLIAMLGTFIDTLIICTLTALVIIMTGAWESGANGAVLTTLAFNTGLPGIGGTIVAIGLSVFAFTTLLGWSYYGECCAVFIFGMRAIVPYRLLWLLAIPMGATGQLTFIWLLADIMNALMALPNLIALILLSPLVFKHTRTYFAKK